MAVIDPRTPWRRKGAFFSIGFALWSVTGHAQVSTTTNPSLQQALNSALSPSPVALSVFSSEPVSLTLKSTAREPSSRAFLGTLERYGLLKEARSVRAVGLSLEQASTAPLHSRFELLGKQVSLIYHERSEEAPQSEYFGFKTEDTREPIYLAVDLEHHTATGYALLNHRSYEIRPEGGEGPSHLLVEIPQLPPYAKGPRPDAGNLQAGDSPNAHPASTRVPTATLAPVDCSKQSRAITVPTPLRIVFGFTTGADAAARVPDAMFIRDQMHLIRGGLEETFKEAGITVAVQILNNGLKIDYQEPGLAGDDVLIQEVTATTDSPNPELQSLRDLRKRLHGDIQVLIVNHDDDKSCGWARNIGVNAREASVVVSFHCMTRKFSVQHEIMHLLGARHDDDPSKNPPFAHAFVYDSGDEPFVTLTGKDVNCVIERSCARDMKLSDPFNTETLSNGHTVTLGVAGSKDNACAVRQNILRAVKFGDSI